MFENIGGKIKGFAIFECLLGIIASIILGILSNADGVPFLGIFVAIMGSIASWVGSFLTYGLGQLIENSDILVKQNRDLLNSNLFKYAAMQGNNQSSEWHSISESTAVKVGETNIKCTNCHQVQFKGNETCTQCGAKFTKILNSNTSLEQSNTPAIKVSETNIKCAKCHQVQFKGNETCTQCGAKFTTIIQQ